MREKSYPRIELRDRDGKSICNVTGFDGLEPFDAILAEFPRGQEEPLKDRPGQAERKELEDNDPGLAPFAAAERNNARIRVELGLPSFWQVWEGDMPAVKPVMGYVNIILPDFHLHLKGGGRSSSLRRKRQARVPCRRRRGR